MALYHNRTRLNTIVTIRIIAVQDPQKTLKIGLASAMKPVDAGIGVYDVHVGPGESIELGDGVDALFLASRGA